AAFTEMAIASLLDSLGRKPTANAAQLLAAFSEVTGDDEVGGLLDLYPVLSAPPVTVAYAVRRLRRLQVFQPTPAEFAQAATLVGEKLHDARAEMFGYRCLWDDVAVLAPDERDEAPDDDGRLPDAD
ncbi:MAG: hypothetical protein ACLP01_11600, partial [Solirubrobacteraceae bacterium]